MSERSITVKVRTGWATNKPTSHELVPRLQKEMYKEDKHGRVHGGNLAALFMHGRSRQQRYEVARLEFSRGLTICHDPHFRPNTRAH